MHHLFETGCKIAHTVVFKCYTRVMTIFGCQNSVTPEPIYKKNFTHNYVCDLTSYA